MEGKGFMALEKTKCLLVPHWFLKKTDEFDYWKFLRIDINNNIPDKQKVIQKYLQRRKKIKKI